MKRKRYGEAQVVFALRQAEEGTSVTEICRKMGVTEATFYRWKKRFAGLGIPAARKRQHRQYRGGGGWAEGRLLRAHNLHSRPPTQRCHWIG